MKTLDLTGRAQRIVDLIERFGGWIDGNDEDVVRFPTPYHMEKFLEALDADKEFQDKQE